MMLLLLLWLQLQQELSASAASALAAAQTQHEQQLLAVREEQQGMVQQAKQDLEALSQQLMEQVRPGCRGVTVGAAGLVESSVFQGAAA
jgi:Cu/Zn superoxide dismutase